MEVIFRSKYALGLQIKEKVIEYIKTGVLAPNEKLPSVREFATQLHVNPNTIVKVYNALEEEGYIYALSKKGYYVMAKGTDTDLDFIKQTLANALKVLSAQQLHHMIDEITQEQVNV